TRLVRNVRRSYATANTNTVLWCHFRGIGIVRGLCLAMGSHRMKQHHTDDETGMIAFQRHGK
ncbi:MAG: hypothetical protein WBF25_02100, partial [Terriglobales bacterium]